MSLPTVESLALRKVISEHRSELDEVLARYNATNPRLFGSVARGDAARGSDIDVLLDLDPAEGRLLMRLAGLTEEFRGILGHSVDVVTPTLLRRRVSATALADAVSL
ncbi:nucleotidyltransferase domain-containing protein [Herbiconiux sp.]|uniref:nucleotidyltransferase family protein n=1 Tax=Herbiconiux sp. TaxID=1871186 RepID=UPI0025BB568F|nr:nucleotidyltransferase domain-containing protein [Herbiconiux sp.]